MSEKQISLKGLRSTIGDIQRAILDEVWAHVKATQIGIPERPLFEKFGKATLSDEVRKLGGTIVYSNHEENRLRYNLAVVGIFLTSDGPRLEKLVERYLIVLRDAYKNDRNIERFSSKDLAIWAPDFTASELNELRHILYRAHDSFASRIAGWNAEEWFISVDDEVVEFKNISDWSGYIESRILKWYDPRQPADEAGRVTYEVSALQTNPVWSAIRQTDKLSAFDATAPYSRKPASSQTSRASSLPKERSALDPWPIIRGFLLRVNSYEVPSVVDRTGLMVDWTLTERENFSHKLRLSAYRPRIDAAYNALPSDEDRLRVAFIVAREIRSHGLGEDLNKALREIGWEFRDNKLFPVGATVRELFFPGQSQHDAYVEIRAIVQRAKAQIVIIDPYIDQTILTLLSTCAKPGMSIQILTSDLPSDFALEAKKWLAQHSGASLEVRATRAFHDRFVAIDNTSCWHIGSSIKDAGQRAFMLSELEDDYNKVALMAHFAKSWSTAAAVVS